MPAGTSALSFLGDNAPSSSNNEERKINPSEISVTSKSSKKEQSPEKHKEEDKVSD